MSNTIKLLFFLLPVLFIFNCGKKEEKPTETILEGKTTILVDETIKPIIEDQIEIFESLYRAKITLVAKSESEVVRALLKDTARIAILTRNLTKEELGVFQKKKIIPKISKFAVDAIALISNKADNDTVIALDDVVAFMQQKPSKIKGLVFDNPNSSTARYIDSLAGIDAFPKNGVFSLGTNERAIRYVAENKGLIGVIGMNWIFEPSPEMKPLVDNINVLRVKPLNGDGYIYPSQNDIGTHQYPLARDLFVANCQGFSGLGMGFSSFIAGDVGQRIILKSGLVPAIMPGRKINIRKSTYNDKK